jgi:uncharacterized protein YbjT (DUF2867 family)
METNSIQSVIVVGATGYLGMAVCQQLIKAGKQVKGLVRVTSDAAKVASLKSLGVETIVGDIKDKNSLDSAFANVDSVISTASSTLSRQEGDGIETVDNAGQLNVVDAAKKAGVKQFVFISFPGLSQANPLQDAKRAVEKHLMASAMTYTILQPTYFMEVWLSPALGFDYTNATATIYGDGKNTISYISLADVAAFAVSSLGNPNAKNKVFELGGPEPITPIAVVKVFEEQSGKAFAINHVPEEALRAQKQSATDALSQSFAALMIGCSEGNNIRMDNTLQAFALTLTSVKDYARRVLMN